VPFVFGFAPQSGTHGAWTYAYSIPSAGEAHDASGKYTVGSATDHGTLALTMTGKDHVVFKGFDGMMPVSYSFKLVPSSSTSCP
jgi:hypothetical protein